MEWRSSITKSNWWSRRTRLERHLSEKIKLVCSSLFRGEMLFIVDVRQHSQLFNVCHYKLFQTCCLSCIMIMSANLLLSWMSTSFKHAVRSRRKERENGRVTQEAFEVRRVFSLCEWFLVSRWKQCSEMRDGEFNARCPARLPHDMHLTTWMLRLCCTKTCRIRPLKLIRPDHHRHHKCLCTVAQSRNFILCLQHLRLSKLSWALQCEVYTLNAFPTCHWTRCNSSEPLSRTWLGNT